MKRKFWHLIDGPHKWPIDQMKRKSWHLIDGLHKWPIDQMKKRIDVSVSRVLRPVFLRPIVSLTVSGTTSLDFERWGRDGSFGVRGAEHSGHNFPCNIPGCSSAASDVSLEGRAQLLAAYGLDDDSIATLRVPVMRDRARRR